MVSTLTGWSPEYEWITTGDKVYPLSIRSKNESGDSSVWVNGDPEKKILFASKTADKSRIEVSWTAPKCVPHIKYFYPFQNRDGFSDLQLSKLLESSRNGVIFAFSDHMHLSIDAKSKIERLVKKLNVSLTVLSDPESPSMEGVKLVSKKLQDLGMTIHYPSLVVYSHGKISSPMLPGYKSEEQYKEFIENYIK